MEPTSLPVSALPTCFAMEVLNVLPTFTPEGKIRGGMRWISYLYLRGGHTPKNEEYATFGEIDSREALTSSTHTRFYLVPSKNHGDEQLVHIKSSYNNKYLMAKVVKQGDKLLVGTADEPDEELSKPSCTLFKVEADRQGLAEDIPPRDGQYRARFSHPVREEVCQFLSNGIDPETGKVLEHLFATINLIDVTGQIVLPPYVAFKGGNDLYLRVGDIEGEPYLEFASKDKADPSATFTTLNYADGTVCIKSELNSKFVSSVREWMWAYYSEPSVEAEFRVLKYGDFFALQSVCNKQFCIATKKGNRDCVTPGAKSITDNAKVSLEEPVLSREIYNIEYHRFDHARIYDTTDMNMATASAINRTSEKNTVKATLSFTTTESIKYDNTVTHKGNVSVSVEGGFKLFKVIDMKVQVQGGYEYSDAKNWGNASQTEKNQTIEYEVSVPPNKKVTLTVTAKQAKYDVPFSYTQKDMLPNGEPRIENFDDGLYSGMNCFDLRYETKEEEIEPRKEENESSKKRKGITE